MSPEELEGRLLKNNLIKEIIVSRIRGGIQAEVFPDEEYAKRNASEISRRQFGRLSMIFNQGYTCVQADQPSQYP